MPEKERVQKSVVYACTSVGDIYPLKVGVSGELVPLSPPVSVVPAAGNPETTASSVVGMAIHPAKRFAYAANLNDGASTVFSTTLKSYRIGPDGILLPLGGASVTIRDIIGEILIDPKGHFLFLFGHRALWIYGIRSTGQMTLVHSTEAFGTFAASDEPEMRARMRDWDRFESCIAFFPSGKSFLIYTLHQWQSDQMVSTAQFRILADGAREMVPSILEGNHSSADFHGAFRFSNDGSLLYRNGECFPDGKTQVEVYQVKPGDRLMRVPSAGIPKSLREIVAFDPLDRFVFGITSGLLDIYRVHPNGIVTYVRSAEVSNNPTGSVFIEASGRFLYILSASLHDPRYTTTTFGTDYRVWNLDSSGVLTPSRRSAVFPSSTCSIETITLP